MGASAVRSHKETFLAAYPRSGLGFRYHVVLDNTVGIIDRDYFTGNTHGHILLKITNMGSYKMPIEEDKAIAQGIITGYHLTDDDSATAARIGGFGSTDTK